MRNIVQSTIFKTRQNSPLFLKDLSKQEYVSAYDIAVIYLGLGEKDQAFAWLERAYEERCPTLEFLKVEPSLDPLRSDPRFADLLRRMNLQP